MHNKYYLKDIEESAERKLFTHISTFSGGGGSCIGVKLAGGDTLLVNEFVDSAIETYKENFPSSKCLVGDIKDFSGQDFLDAAGIKKGELDIFEGSPPCSAFSIAGSREKGWNKEKTYSNNKKVENIEDLFFEFIRIAKDINPKVIIAENVRGLTIGNAKKYLNKILNSFEEIGYISTYKIINSLDHGVAQSRSRVIFVCVREDIAKERGIESYNINDLYALDREYRLTLNDVIGDLVDDPYHYGEEEYNTKIFNRRMGENKDSDFARCIQELSTPNSDNDNNGLSEFFELDDSESHTSVAPNHNKAMNFSSLPWCKEKYFCYYLLSMNSFCPTLTQTGLRGAANYIHPSAERLISLKEAIRLFGLPEDYKFGKDTKIADNFERIGRMVTPFIYLDLCKNIYEKVLK